MDPWSRFKLATCMPDHCFCETIHYGAWIRQPINTWSNLAFVLVAFYIISLIGKGQQQAGKNILIQSKVHQWVYAISCLLVGLGSFYYHASFTFHGQWLDVMGMYLAITFFVLYNFQRIYQFKTHSFVLGYIAVNAVLGYLLYAVPELRRYMFGLFVVLLLVVALITQAKLKTKINRNYLFKAVGAFAAGMSIWILDLKKILCFPDSWFQGHALWHFFTALASYYIYAYYRSEDAKKD